MGNLGGMEILVIFIIALVVLGPSKLPEAARQVGKAVTELRRVSSGFQRELRDAIDEPVAEAKAVFKEPLAETKALIQNPVDGTPRPAKPGPVDGRPPPEAPPPGPVETPSEVGPDADGNPTESSSDA